MYVFCYVRTHTHTRVLSFRSPFTLNSHRNVKFKNNYFIVEKRCYEWTCISSPSSFSIVEGKMRDRTSMRRNTRHENNGFRAWTRLGWTAISWPATKATTCPWKRLRCTKSTEPYITVIDFADERSKWTHNSSTIIHKSRACMCVCVCVNLSSDD